MNTRHRAILGRLGSTPSRTRDLAYYLQCPEPSIRRTIQELRQMGWLIDSHKDVFYLREGFDRNAHPPAQELALQ